MSKTSAGFIVILCLASFLTIFPDLAFATPQGSNIGKYLCISASWFSGNAGKGLAMIALFIIATTAFYGKITWGMAILVGIGVAILFGADALVVALGGFNCRGNFTIVTPPIGNG